jgi:hypothetical protein
MENELSITIFRAPWETFPYLLVVGLRGPFLDTPFLALYS